MTGDVDVLGVDAPLLPQCLEHRVDKLQVAVARACPACLPAAAFAVGVRQPAGRVEPLGVDRRPRSGQLVAWNDRGGLETVAAMPVENKHERPPPSWHRRAGERVPHGPTPSTLPFPPLLPHPSVGAADGGELTNQQCEQRASPDNPLSGLWHACRTRRPALVIPRIAHRASIGLGDRVLRLGLFRRWRPPPRSSNVLPTPRLPRPRGSAR